MATITTINASDQITNARTVINTNFANLNSDKIETSVIDTDTALAANSDSKIPSQKAVKTYIDTSGGANASETVRGIVEEATDAEVASASATGGTGAKLFVTPTKLASSRHSASKSVTAGATISGATLPVPVFQDKTDNEFYACDGNDLTKLKFLGFAVSNGTDGNAMTVQFNGVVGGFTSLDEGEKYYLSDTVGTIQNSPGTYEVVVGVAISTTELLIQKGKRYASGTTTITGTGNTTITTGFRASKIKVDAVGSATDTNGMGSAGGWTVFGGNRCIRWYIEDGAGSNGGASATGQVFDITEQDGGSSTIGTISSVTDTTFVINCSAFAANAYLYWEAEGEL